MVKRQRAPRDRKRNSGGSLTLDRRPHYARPSIPSQLSARRIDVTSLALPELDVHSAAFEDLAKARDRGLAWRHVRQAFDRIVRNHIQQHGAISQQLDKLPGVLIRVVDSAQQHVLERQPPTAGIKVAIRRVEDRSIPIFLLTGTNSLRRWSFGA